MFKERKEEGDRIVDESQDSAYLVEAGIRMEKEPESLAEVYRVWQELRKEEGKNYVGDMLII